MWITPAYAQAGGGGGDAIMQFLPLIAIFVIFYFLLIRPQQKRAKEHRQALSAIRRGDRIVTGGGIIGTVTRVKEDTDELTVEIAEGVKVAVARPTVAQVLSKPDPGAPAAGAGGGPTVVTGNDNKSQGGLGGMLGGLLGGGRR